MPAPRSRPHGFTLVELIVTIIVLGVLAGIAVPRYLDISDKAAAARVAENMKILSRAYLSYHRDYGVWPPDNDGSGYGFFYAEPYLTNNIWESTSAIGGRYNWNFIGGLAEVVIYNVGTSPSSRTLGIMTDIDRQIDDGNTATGRLRWDPSVWGGTLRYALN